MEKIFNVYKKMSVEDAICILCLLGFGLMMFAIFGIFGQFLVEWAAAWLLFSGVVVSFLGVTLLFGTNGCFMHDISAESK